MNDQVEQMGKFIVLEGIDFAGKTTQVKRVKTALEALGVSVVTTREPGGTPMAEAIRGVVIGDWDEVISGETELMLMFAARNQHLSNFIIPQLMAGKWVICDRYVNSSFAYQVVGQDMSPDLFFALMEHTILNKGERGVPNHTFILDISDDTSKDRCMTGDRPDAVSRFDVMSDEKRSKVNEQTRAFGQMPNTTVVDGEASEDAITQQIVDKLRELYL